MEWSELLNVVLKLFVIPVIGILLTTLVKFIHIKGQELIEKCNNDILDKYILMAQNVVIACVTATNQTFVESLKQQGLFDKEAQKEAFNRTKEAVLTILTEEAKTFLISAVGDLDTYLNALIEAEVNNSKSLIPLHQSTIIE